jgi:hypothetical protein
MSDPHPPSPHPEESTPKARASLLDVAGAVFWSFFGVRKGNAMRRDAVAIRPHQVIIVGIVLAAIFVATLLVLVRVIVSAAGA